MFPRRTAATPDDSLVYVACPPPFTLDEIDEVHISVTFTYDLSYAEILLRQWSAVGVPVKIGGPALYEPGGGFIPGLYLKRGYVITSRGCPNRCWFCKVPQREGGEVRELPITHGWNVLDDNLLACSEQHIRSVFAMLSQQRERILITGGLEAARLKPWHVELLRSVKAKRIYFAYDTPEDYEPLVEAGKMMFGGGFTRDSDSLRCYVLYGYPGDTVKHAEKRLKDTFDAGFMPFAMLYHDTNGNYNRDMKRLQNEWIRPAIVMSNLGASNRK